MIDHVIIAIPAYKPDDRLITYVKNLIGQGFSHVVVVDDGSGKEFDEIFNSVDTSGATVIRKEVNGGKGAALKTSYRYIKENFQDSIGVITADSDGQHTVADCKKIAERMVEDRENVKHSLYLGSRDFSSNNKNVPFKSRFGNRITSVVFKLLHGQYLSDTQTGLRGFFSEDLDAMCNIDGDRYEYEMRVLIQWKKWGFSFVEIPIETIYENNNEGSHFNPVRDSFKIYKVIFETFFKYSGVSILSFLLDNLLFNASSLFMIRVLNITQIATIDWTSGFFARIFSSIFNYSMNRKMVFKSDRKNSFVKYCILCVVIIVLSNLFVTLLDSIGMPRYIAKPLCDVLLYFVSYSAQRKWVF